MQKDELNEPTKKENKRKGVPQPRLEKEEKIAKVKAICEMYAEGKYLLEYCANFYNVSYRTFYSWLKDTELAKIYEETNAEVERNCILRIRGKAIKAIDSYLDSEEVKKTERVYTTKEIIDEQGNKRVVKALKEEREIIYIRKPSERVAMWAAEKLVQDFTPKQEINHTGKAVIILPAEKELPNEENITLDDLLKNAE